MKTHRQIDASKIIPFHEEVLESSLLKDNAIVVPLFYEVKRKLDKHSISYLELYHCMRNWLLYENI